MKNKFYVTTAIDYVNARPHIGHAFEKVIADALVRWKKKKDYDVFFLTGVDENAQKNVQAAEAAGVSVKDFVDKNTGFFLELCKKLNISYDKFIRTSASEHAKVVQEILKKIINKGDIYRGEYEGYYCIGCETYITEKDLVDGKCPEHNKVPEHMKEQAYFFRLSKYQNKLIKFVEKYIVPESKKKEILFRLKQGLKDVCITRKDVEWGIDFPLDKKYKVWVWVDALINYISGAKKQWPADVHVIGKGINWFHSVIWPAILMSAGYKLPGKLLVHGYLISGGKKMSKSLGNVIDPLELLNKYSTDAVRYALFRCNVFDDSDFNEEILIARHNNELANKLGNLVSRVAGLIEQNGIEKCENRGLDIKWKKLLKERKVTIRGAIFSSNLDKEKLIGGSHLSLDYLNKGNLQIKEISNLQEIIDVTIIEVENYFNSFEFDKALNSIFRLIDYCNWYVQNKKIWETKDKKILYELKESILKIADLLLPFIPESAEKIMKQFSAAKIKKGEILFKKI